MLARRKPLQRSGFIKRAKPLKPRPRKRAPALERRHIARVATMPCLISGKPATVHHVTAGIHGGRISRSDRRVVPLAPEYHQKVHDPKASDPISVEGLSHAGFFRKYGIDLLAVAELLWRETVEMEARSGA